MHITNLPVETLDHIAASIDSPTDLANLAAASSQLGLIVAPYHTQLRIIRAPLVSPIWQRLATDHSLAQNVRVLEIQSDEPHGRSRGATVNKPRVPAMFGDHAHEAPQIAVADPGANEDEEEDDEEEEDIRVIRARNAAKNAVDLDAERSLVSALQGMSGLTAFLWTRTPPLINPQLEDDIWTTLAKYCPELSSVDVLDREKPFDPALEDTDDDAYQRPTFNPKFYLFHDLKSFSLKTEAFNVGGFAVPDFEQGKKMLVEKCPDLEVLTLQLILYANPHSKTVPAAPLFSATWAHLREIVLFGFEIISSQLDSFLTSHPTIEVLSLTACTILGSSSLPPGALPHLKRLSAVATVTHSVLDSTTEVPRPLESLVASPLGDVLFDKLEQSGCGMTLKMLNTGCHNTDELPHLVTRLARIAPNLESFHIRCSTNVAIDRSLYPVFGQLPRLHTLLGVRFLDSRCEPASANTETMKALAAACPNLRRLDWYNGEFYDDSLGVVIERNGSQVTWSIHTMSRRHVVGSPYNGWGERGCGSFQL